MILHIHCIQSSFEPIFMNMGNGLVQHLVDTFRMQYINTMTVILQNSGVFDNQPFILDGTNPGAFLSILNNGKPCDEFENKKEAVSLEEKQQEIVNSWRELENVKSVISETLPVGIYNQNGELVDNRQPGKFLSKGAAIFDFEDCMITNSIRDVESEDTATEF